MTLSDKEGGMKCGHDKFFEDSVLRCMKCEEAKDLIISEQKEKIEELNTSLDEMTESAAGNICSYCLEHRTDACYHLRKVAEALGFKTTNDDTFMTEIEIPAHRLIEEVAKLRLCVRTMAWEDHPYTKDLQLQNSELKERIQILVPQLSAGEREVEKLSAHLELCREALVGLLQVRQVTKWGGSVWDKAEEALAKLKGTP